LELTEKTANYEILIGVTVRLAMQSLKKTEPTKFSKEEVDKFLKAISHPTRRSIIASLKKKDMSLSDISRSVSISPALTKKHIRHLYSLEILSRKKLNGSTLYHLSTTVLQDFIDSSCETLNDVMGTRDLYTHAGQVEFDAC
jgi:DNA-binding transcriptional ArsR family regulator